jgi:hypothetical protein
VSRTTIINAPFASVASPKTRTSLLVRR